MTDRDPREPAEEGDDASDWLASQFDPTGELPKQPPVPPAAQPPAAPPPAAPQQPYIAPPAFPGQQQPTPPPAFTPVQQQPPVPPSATPPSATPPQRPVAPAFPLPPQPPAQPPAAPAFPLPPAQPTPPAVAPPAAAPVPPAPSPAAPAPAGGFSWGLTPGGSAEQPPAQPYAPVLPPAPPAPAPPAPTPPAPTRPPAPIPPTPAPPAQPPVEPLARPGTWFEPVAPAAPVAPHDAPPLDSAIAGVPPESTPPPEPMPFETTVLPDVAPDSRDAPAFWEPEPTQTMDVLELERETPVEPAPKQPFTRSVFPEGSELLPEAEPAATTAFGAPPGETGAVSAIDSLFGETQFREYSDRPDPGENPFVRKAEADRADPGGPAGPPPGISPVQRILLSVLGALLAVIILVGLFFLGIRLPDLLGPAPAIASPSASPSPSASAEIALGPVAPGDYHWDELLGGECLDPFESAFQDDYTVVDCAEPHAAQMVRTGILPVIVPTDGTVVDEDEYPGEEALQTQTLGLCRVAGIFAPTAAALTDALITSSYPTSEQWDEGNRSYYCFVSRSSGEPITGDLALPQVAPVVPVEPAP